MSWIQLHDRVWPVTTDEAKLRVFIRPPDVMCPRVSWDLSVHHYPDDEVASEPEHRTVEQWLHLDLGGLVLDLTDWRRLTGLELRADAAWHAMQEYIGPHGGCHNSPRVSVRQTVIVKQSGTVAATHANWTAHDFILRLGNRDGQSFPCELDAWLIPDDEYHRCEPETPADAARFAVGPPSFRLLTRATFAGGTVELTRRAAVNPLAAARQSLVELIACESFSKPTLNWHLRQSPDGGKIGPMPRWRSYVQFSTEE